MANKIEVFTAGCSFCNSAVELVNSSVKKDDEVIVYNLNDEERKKDYKEIADVYGVKTVPAVVVNSKLLGCCKTSGVSKDILLAALG